MQPGVTGCKPGVNRLLTVPRQVLILILLLGSALGSGYPFQVGERLEYTALFNVIPAGEASLEILKVDTLNGQPSYHVRFSAQTGSLADRLYKIRDQVNVWLDLKGLHTHQLTKEIREGNYRYRSHTVLNYSDSTAITNGDTVTIARPVRDPYSLFYYLRSIPLLLGRTLRFTSFENNKTIPFQIQVTRRETVTTPLGPFSCLVVKPFRKGRALLKNRGDMKIWFSDDVRRLPVQIQIKLKYGSLLLKLKNFSRP